MGRKRNGTQRPLKVLLASGELRNQQVSSKGGISSQISPGGLPLPSPPPQADHVLLGQESGPIHDPGA